jgi:hypothetical protein
LNSTSRRKSHRPDERGDDQNDYPRDAAIQDSSSRMGDGLEEKLSGGVFYRPDLAADRRGSEP